MFVFLWPACYPLSFQSGWLKPSVHVGAFTQCTIHSALISSMTAPALCVFSLVDDIQSVVLKINMSKEDNTLIIRHTVFTSHCRA